MKPTRHNKQRVFALHRPLVLPDYRERLRALLPELLASIVAATCALTIVGYSDGADLASVVTVSFFIQLLVQSFMYACVYLLDISNNTWVVHLLWLSIIMNTPLGSILSYSHALPYGSGSDGLNYLTMISGLFGMLFFYLTRLRPTFLMFIVEIPVFAGVIDEMPGMFPVHLVAYLSIAVLFVLRCSDTRITMSVDAGRPAREKAEAQTRSAFGLGVLGQVVALAVVSAVLSTAVAFTGTLPMLLRSESNAVTADTPAETPQEAPPKEDDTQLQDVAEGADGSETVERNPQADTRDAADTPSPRGGLRVPTGLLLAALLVLPFAVRLLLRWHARRSLEREPRPADRAARIYLAILSRLEAVGITRGETETPQEFLMGHEDELTEFVTSAELESEAWTTLTDIYEMARYAGVDPTDGALAACWQLYDAMPLCARTNLGWIRYLIGPFWKM